MGPQPLTNATAANNLLRLLMLNYSDFLFRRFYQEAEKAYRANPNDLFSQFLFAKAESLRNIVGSDIIFSDIVISKLSSQVNIPEQLEKEIYCYYAALLYHNNRYKEALEAFNRGGSFEYLILSPTSFFSGLGIYFENQEYQKILDLPEEILNYKDFIDKKDFVKLDIRLLEISIYQALSFYETGNMPQALNVLESLMESLNFKPLNTSNINDFVELLKNMPVNKIFKPTLTVKEENCLKGIKDLLEFYSKSEETSEILVDEKLMKKLKSSISQISSDNTLSWEEAEAVLGW